MTTIVLFIAVAFAMLMTPLIRQLALRIRFVSVPKQDREHRVTTPMMGGVALYIGFTGALVLLLAVIRFVSALNVVDSSITLNEMVMVIVSGTILALTGLWDDWKPLKPVLKISFQMLSIVLLWFTTSVRTNIGIPLELNFLVTAIWFLYTINAFNYMDNMDGVAAMVATVAGMFFTVIAIITGQLLLASIAAAVAGTSFGFLRDNLFRPEKKIFMGDAGSLFLGFLLAVIGIKLQFTAASPWVTWPVPVLVFAIPIFDTGLVFISRMRRGVSFLQGGTDHLSHRLKRMSLGRFGVPFAVGLMGTASGCAGLIVMHSSLSNSIITQIFAAMIALYMLYKLELAASYKFITGKAPPEPSTPTETQG